MTINCGGNLIELSTPKILGIVNLTPDSFYDGGSLRNDTHLLNKVEKMLLDGADFIDLGGYSSRPGATDISIAEEIKRVAPIISLLRNEFPDILISIDTFRSEVANTCLEIGATMINDISAGNLDKEMMSIIASFNVPYIMMHMKGTPQNMQSLATYKDITEEVIFYFSEKIKSARALGINDIIIDAGFGFAKTIDHNFELLNNLELLQSLDVPLLTGISRKSMIYKTLQNTPTEALNGTTALHMIALQKGSKILRVHDVALAKECILLYEALKKSEN